MKTAWVLVMGLGLALLVVSCTKPSAGDGSGCTSAQMLCNGSCANIKSDSQNCGACGYSCDTGTTCKAGVCACSPGLVECSSACVSSNTEHCGTSCAACPSGNVCSNGQCSASCPSGSTMCTDGACGSDTDSAHCGSGCAVCSGGTTCVNGTCGCSVAGQQNCGGACIDTTSSMSHCGSCDVACSSDQSCTNSNCVGVSTGGQTGAGGTPGGTGGRGGGTGTGGTGGGGGAPPVAPTLITSAPNAYWKTNSQWTVTTAGTAADVTVNDTTMAQTFEGFGGAFNEAGWNYLNMLSATDKDRALKLLFDGTDGAHFVIGRIPIGASDYALVRYTNDETANDTALTSFSTSRDMMYLIPYVKAAQAINSSIRLWASPWTPPTWMKTRTGTVVAGGTSCGNPVNGTMTDSNVFDGGCMQDIPANLTALAQYFVRWIKDYAAQGITIETLAPQNEPNYAQGYPSALWAPALYTKFIPILNTALTGASLSTKIMLGTMSNGDNGATSKDLVVVQAVMADATAKNLVKVMGLQWGMLDLYEGKTGGVSAATFNTGSMPVWATEHKCGNYPWLTGYKEPAPNDQAYGVESWGFIRDAVKGGVTAYNAWNMVLDTVGKGNDLIRPWSQDTLLAVNTSTKALVLTPAYYVFRHVSQYVQPGARVVSTTGGDAIAFKNPNGTIITVMYNSGATKTAIVAVGGKKLQFALPGTGWATVIYTP